MIQRERLAPHTAEANAAYTLQHFIPSFKYYGKFKSELNNCKILAVDIRKHHIVHFGVTRPPTNRWLAQQLREAAHFGEGPRFLIHDDDRKYEASFRHVSIGAGIKILRIPYRAPKANAICERFPGSFRRECLDHFILLSERHAHRIVKQYIQYSNYARPQHGIDQQIPCRSTSIDHSVTAGIGGLASQLSATRSLRINLGGTSDNIQSRGSTSFTKYPADTVKPFFLDPEQALELVDLDRSRYASRRMRFFGHHKLTRRDLTSFVRTFGRAPVRSLHRCRTMKLTRKGRLL